MSIECINGIKYMEGDFFLDKNILNIVSNTRFSTSGNYPTFTENFLCILRQWEEACLCSILSRMIRLTPSSILNVEF